MALYKSAFGRELTPNVYRTFAIEDTSQEALYQKLANLVKDLTNEYGHLLVESIAPSIHDDGEFVYALVVTVAI